MDEGLGEEEVEHEREVEESGSKFIDLSDFGSTEGIFTFRIIHLETYTNGSLISIRFGKMVLGFCTSSIC